MNKKKLLWQVPFLTILIVGSILIVSKQNDVTYHNDRGFIFGTTYNITYQNKENLHAEIKAELMKVDSSLSVFNFESTITQVNRNKQFDADIMLAHVFQLAQSISEETNGAFDITVAPLVNAWGFGFEESKSPTPAAIDSLKEMVGYKKVKIIDNTIIKQDPRIMLDCSAIAKGYGCDVVANLLERHGIKNFMVEIGGEIVTLGNSPKRQPWKIGVSKPTEDSLSTSGELQRVLNVTDKAMATSGNYRNFYYKDGKRFAHTINPETGYPVEHSLLSATVLADNCATADAYATAFMVMGLEKAKRLLEKHPELLVYFIYDEDGELKEDLSEGLER
jgi:thiamine biosynthesis lipoprotein